MKKSIVLFIVFLAAVGFAFADQEVLIDFTKLVADAEGQNSHTSLDYGEEFARQGSNYTDAQKAQMKTSLALGNWEVVLNSSNARPANSALSKTAEAESKGFEKVLGVRVHFPVENWNGSAVIKPPFEIPAFYPPENADNYRANSDLSRFEDGYGIIKNVGAIKSITVRVYGLNFPHRLWIRYIDQEGVTKEVSPGNLKYDGWGRLTWENPNYVQDVRKRELRLYPIYPDNTPYIKFAGFRIERDAAQKGGDFVTYFKDVEVIYDKAVLDPAGRDIDDENLWNIIQTREDNKRRDEMKNFGQQELLRYLDTEKQANQTAFGSFDFNPVEKNNSSGPQGQQGGGQQTAPQQ
ncbi:MAG: flagellar filament outer layer protein FlaA [Treponema sp.]|jgi:hypothetical protein|nr:flagellar filament outer layer protein FlaA [Treponema sp.]